MEKRMNHGWTVGRVDGGIFIFIVSFVEIVRDRPLSLEKYP